MMVKKFASITAMAKTEKRLNRRTLTTPGVEASASNLSTAYGSATDSRLDYLGLSSQQQPRVTITAGPPSRIRSPAPAIGITATTAISRTPPSRTMSMRERRYPDSSQIPRSQSGKYLSF